MTSDRMHQAAWLCATVLVLLAGCTQGAPGASKGGPLRIYWVDVEGGAATLIVTPAGESILVDTGLDGPD